MKGIIEQIGGTMIVIIAAFFVVIATLMMTIYFKYTSPSFSAYSPDYVAMAMHPYTIAASLASYMDGNRQLIEESIETSVTGSQEDASAHELKSTIKNFLKPYGLDFYSVSIKKGDREVLYVDSIDDRCGNNLEGVCVSEIQGSSKCSIGRVEIDEGANTCGVLEQCCKEDRIPDGSWRGNVIQCGEIVNGRKAGVCDYNVGIFTNQCAEGRIVIDDKNDDCKSIMGFVRGIQLPIRIRQDYVCCMPVTDIGRVHTDYASTAEVPLLYSSSTATMEVAVK